MRVLGVSSIIFGILVLGVEARAEDFEVKLDGFILPNYVLATSAMNSFTTQTETAPTAVAVGTGNGGLNSSSRASWQIGQSRFGLNLKYGAKLSGRVEVDFWNNNDASPEFALLAPRLRVAKLEYKVSDGFTLLAGQDYDIFGGGVGAVTYNFVGNYFQAGNVAFIRQQFAAKFGGPTGLNFAFAIGMPQKNDNGATGAPVADGAAELTMLPSFEANLTYKQDEKNYVGVAAVATRVLYTTSTSDAHAVYGADIFAVEHIGSVELKGKLYYGQNLNNINMLTLASGGGTAGANNAYDFSEVGGFLSGRIPVIESIGTFFGLGYATGLNSSSIPASITSNILTSNLKASGGIDFLLTERLKFFGEYSYFNSTYNQGSTSNVVSYNASVINLGMKLEI